MKKILTTIAFSLLATSAMASEVYIDQAGGSLNIDILQENGNNRVNTESDPMDADGNDIDIDIVQSGDANTADLNFSMGADSTVFNYSATGDLNVIYGEIYGGIANTMTTTIIGSENLITYCKDYTNSVCNGIIVNNTDTTVTITGSNNETNLALDSADSVNTFDIGSTTPSDLNETNLTQTSTGGYDVVTVTLDGDSNITNLTQDTTDGNNQIVMNIVGSSNGIEVNQTGAAGYNQFNMDLTGSNNTITADQQTATGYTYVNATITGDSNTVDIVQN
mgnify:CR=1 FL=1